VLTESHAANCVYCTATDRADSVLLIVFTVTGAAVLTAPNTTDVFRQLLIVLRAPNVADCAFQWPVLTVLTESHAVDCVYSASCYLRLKSLTLLTLLYNAADGSYSGTCR
jgi:hypothetical protein